MKQKLIEILKAVPEIKEDLEELRFGSIVEYNYFGKERINTFIGISPNNRRQVVHQSIGCATTGKVSTFNKNDILSISNPIQERHLRMYCEKKKIMLFIENNLLLLSHKFHIEGLGSQDSDNIYLDNIKDFNNQTNEVYSAIVKFLENNK